MAQKLRLGLPKGSLQQSTFDLIRRAGYTIRGDERSYRPVLDDDEIDCVLFRAQEISRYVADGVLDIGLTGEDWIRENRSDVRRIIELVYSKATAEPARWVLAVPKDSPVQKPEDLAGKLIATELVAVTEGYLNGRGVQAQVEFSWGATEAKAGVVDAIVELTETGRTLDRHGLRIVDTVMTTTPQLIANHEACDNPWKREKMENLAVLLTGAIIGRSKVGLKMNVSADHKEKVLHELKALRHPTVSPLATGGWFAIEVVMDESDAREMIPRLKRAGAEGIIEYPLNKVIL